MRWREMELYPRMVFEPSSDVLVLMNKPAEPRTVSVDLLNYQPTPSADAFTHSSTTWTTAGDATEMTQTATDAPQRRDSAVVMPPYSLRIAVIPRAGAK